MRQDNEVSKYMEIFIKKFSNEVSNLVTNEEFKTTVVVIDLVENILIQAKNIEKSVMCVELNANKFDCCDEIKANGFRSLIALPAKVLSNLEQDFEKYKEQRNKMFYNMKDFENKLREYRDLLNSLHFIISFSEKLMSSLMKNSLIENDNKQIEKNALNISTKSQGNEKIDHHSDQKCITGLISSQGKSPSSSCHSSAPSNSGFNDKLMLFVKPDDPCNLILNESDVFIDKSFYGSLVGFQYMSAIKETMVGLANIFAAFSDGFEEYDSKFGRFVFSLKKGLSYTFNSEKRAERLLKTYSKLKIDLLKDFWAITDSHYFLSLTECLLPNIDVDTVVRIPCDKDFELTTNDCKFKIKKLNGKSAIKARLFSRDFHEGQAKLHELSASKDFFNFFKRKPIPNSKYLIFQIPGGGFISQTPKSHSLYLKGWAKSLGVPIISIDYSKSPEHPFPNAVEECFYAYCWALKNHKLLGSTAEKILIVGDSAGGNLIYSVIIQAICAGIKLPSAIFAFYPVLVIKPVTSASKLISLCEILLSSEIVKLCLHSYIPDAINSSNRNYIDEMVNATLYAADDNLQTNQNAIHKTHRVSKNSDRISKSSDWISENTSRILEKSDRISENSDRVLGSSGRIKEKTCRISEKSETCVEIKPFDNELCRNSDITSGNSDFIETIHMNNQIRDMECTAKNIPGQFNEKVCTKKILGDQDASNNSSFSNIHENHKKMSNFSNEIESAKDFMQNKNQNEKYISSKNKKIHFGDINSKKRSTIVENISSEQLEDSRQNENSTNHLYRFDGWNEEKEMISSHPLCSPMYTPSNIMKKFPPSYIYASDIDPLLDDSIDFTKRLLRAGAPVKLEVYEGLPHGFLQFTNVCKNVMNISNKVSRTMHKIFRS